jgi:L-ornithine N5-oxygenase
VSEFYNQPVNVRESANIENRCTNYGVVRLELLERLYEKLYMQRIRYGNDERDWPHRIIPNSTVIAVNAFDKFISIHTDVFGKDGLQAMDFDFVIVATGYTRSEHEKLLGEWIHDIPGRDQSHRSWTVGRDYRVNFESEPAINSEAGIWLQGCNENTHGVRNPRNAFPCNNKFADISLAF